MKAHINTFVLVRRLAASVSLVAMTAVFFLPAAARWCGWLPRLQLVPAILAGAVLELVVLVVSVALFGRLYCSVLCPLGIVQDLFRFCFSWVRPRADAPSAARQNGIRIVRLSVLALFVVAVLFGFTGFLEPYGIFGRFLAAGVRRVGEPGIAVAVWSIGLFALVLLLTFVRPRFWCNRLCPVGTFLGLFSRLACFRVRVRPAACVKCGACAKRCDKGALVVRDGQPAVADLSSCVVCGNCLGSCPKDALTFSRD